MMDRRIAKFVSAALLCFTLQAPSAALSQDGDRAARRGARSPYGRSGERLLPGEPEPVGPYRLTFCLDRRGTYTVRGGGLNCDGRLDWRTAGRNIHIDLRRASCGRGQAWERASIECRSAGGLLGAIGRVVVGQSRGSAP